MLLTTCYLPAASFFPNTNEEPLRLGASQRRFRHADHMMLVTVGGGGGKDDEDGSDEARRDADAERGRGVPARHAPWYVQPS